MLRIMYCSICYHYYPCHVSCSIRSTWESSCWCCSVLSISHFSFSLVFDIERMSFWLLTLVRPLPAVQSNFWIRRAALFSAVDVLPSVSCFPSLLSALLRLSVLDALVLRQRQWRAESQIHRRSETAATINALHHPSLAYSKIVIIRETKRN